MRRCSTADRSRESSPSVCLRWRKGRFQRRSFRVAHVKGSSSLLSFRRCTKSASPPVSALSSTAVRDVFSSSVRDARRHKMSPAHTSASPMTISAIPRLFILRPQKRAFYPRLFPALVDEILRAAKPARSLLPGTRIRAGGQSRDDKITRTGIPAELARRHRRDGRVEGTLLRRKNLEAALSLVDRTFFADVPILGRDSRVRDQFRDGYAELPALNRTCWQRLSDEH
jgi:hypothetical protein